MRTWMELIAIIILVPAITIAGQWLLNQQVMKAEYANLARKIEEGRTAHIDLARQQAQERWSELSNGGDKLSSLPEEIRATLCLSPRPELLNAPAISPEDYDFRSIWDYLGNWQLTAFATLADRYGRLVAALKENCAIVRQGKSSTPG